MKLLIIGPNSKENKMLVKAAQQSGHDVLLCSLNKISFIIKNNELKAWMNGNVLADYDICLFRGIAPHFAKAKTLAKYLHFHKVKVIDRELYSRVYEFDKMFMTFEFFQKDLPCVDSFHFSSNKELRKNIGKLPDQIFIKDIQGMHSRNIFYFESKEKFQDFFKKHKAKKFLIQKTVKEDYYYRVLVVGDKVLGAMKRMSYLNPAREKTSLPSRSSAAQLTQELKQLALKAARATNTDIAGVDIIYDQDKPKLLEVNRSPKFKRFTQVMKINVAPEIIKYLEKQKQII